MMDFICFDRYLVHYDRLRSSATSVKYITKLSGYFDENNSEVSILPES